MPAVTRQFPFSLNIETDADVIAYLDSQDNRTEAIRKAIRFWIALEDEDVKE